MRTLGNASPRPPRRLRPVRRAGRDPRPDRLRMGDEVRLRVRAGLDAPVDRLYLRTDARRRAGRSRSWSRSRRGPACRWWEIDDPADDAGDRLPVPGRRPRTATAGSTGPGSTGRPPTDPDDFRLVAGFDPPAWLADRVFYQVFPDRFAERRPRQRRRRRRLDLSRAAGPAAARWDEPPSAGAGGARRVLRRRPARASRAGSTTSSTSASTRSTSTPSSSPARTTATTRSTTATSPAHFGGDAALVSLRRATQRARHRA